MNMTELCAELRNYFIHDPDRDVVTGEFEIVDGSITPTPYLHNGAYFRIVGSRLNDGVYKNDPVSLSELKDETFTGAVWLMSVPPSVESLLDEISEWETSTADAKKSPFQSESFGGYTYSLKSGNAENGASALSWQGAFAERLKPYRRQAVLI